MPDNVLNKFYVYAYLDPRKPGKYVYGDYSFDYEPFYIGKGGTKRQLKRHLFETKNRTKNSLKYRKIQSILKFGLIPITKKILENIKEDKAFSLEEKLIKIIGRIDLKTGPLTNLKDGGIGGQSNPSSLTRKKLSVATKGKTYEEIYGKEKALELKKSRSNSNSKRKLSQYTKNKISEKHCKITWKITNPNGKICLIKNLQKFCKENNLTSNSMWCVANKKQNHHKGWKCEYA